MTISLQFTWFNANYVTRSNTTIYIALVLDMISMALVLEMISMAFVLEIISMA